MNLTGEKITLGIISDTHNPRRTEAVEKLKDADLIIYADNVTRQSFGSLPEVAIFVQ